jgi:WD40 repeat protein
MSAAFSTPWRSAPTASSLPQPVSILATSGGTDGLVRLWNTATGKQIGKYFAADFVDSVAVSPDGKILATGSPDGTARLRDLATGRQIGGPLAGDIAKVNGGVDSVAFSPDGKILATGGDNGTVRLWDVATGFYPGVSSKIANGDAAWPRPWYGPRIEPPDSVRPTG